jgi:hypothetical protein
MKDENCENVVKKHMEKYGHLEILINNVSLALKGWEGGLPPRADMDVTVVRYRLQNRSRLRTLPTST